jgi:hypothetical protein
MSRITYRKAQPKPNKNIFLPDDSVLDLFKESWLKISYKKLTSTTVFPTLNLPDFSQTWVETDHNFFRKNRLFNEAAKKNPQFPPSENSFFVRLNGLNLFYADDAKSLVTLGSIPVNTLFRSEKSAPSKTEPNCFQLYDSGNFAWKLCAQTLNLRNESPRV